MWYIAAFYIFMFSLLCSILLVPVFKYLSIRFQYVDNPGERKHQKQPIPILGGPAIFISFFGTIFIHLFAIKLLAGSSLFGIIPQEIREYIPNMFGLLRKLFGIFLGSLMLLVMGLIDDKRPLSALPKLAVQLLSAVILFCLDIKITLFTDNIIISLALTIFWVIFITNAFNFLDNMDGLSSGLAIISLFFLLIISVSQNEYFMSVFITAFIGALLGFIIYNFHPARIYMGDSGSQIIGYIMASITILGTYYYKEYPNIFSVVMPVIILGVPIYDLMSVVGIRVFQGRPIYKGDRSHFSHRLSSLGMGTVGSVLFIYLVAFSLGLSALLLGMVNNWGVKIIFLQFVSFLVIIALLEYYSKKESLP